MLDSIKTYYDRYTGTANLINFINNSELYDKLID